MHVDVSSRDVCGGAHHGVHVDKAHVVLTISNYAYVGQEHSRSGVELDRAMDTSVIERVKVVVLDKLVSVKPGQEGKVSWSKELRRGPRILGHTEVDR